MGLFDYRTYLVDEKLLSVRDTLVIKDEKGRELGKAVKRLLALREEIEFIDSQGKKVGAVKRKMVTVAPAFEVYDQGKKRVANIKKKIVAIGDDWWVEDKKGKKILNVDGNILDLEYKIKDKLGQEVALVSRKLFSIRDHYGVKIVGDVDPLLVLATVVSINMEKERKEKD